jgi:hypothetical protein
MAAIDSFSRRRHRQAITGMFEMQWLEDKLQELER